MTTYALDQGRLRSDAFLFVFRQIRLIGAVFFTALIVAVIGVFFTTPTYEATTKILVKTDDRAKMAVSAGDSSPAIVARNVSYEELESQAYMMMSMDFLAEVVKALAQSSSSQQSDSESAIAIFFNSSIDMIRAALRWPFSLLQRLYEALHGIEDVRTPVQRQAELLKSDLTVAPHQGSNLLLITYENENPVRAARVANTIATSYLEYYAKVFTPTAAEQFFAEQTTAFNGQLSAAEARLSAFHKEHNVFDFPTQRNEMLGKLVEFEALLKTTQTEASAERERVLALKTEVAAHPTQIPSSAQEEPDPIITRVKSSLLDLELQRDDLLTRYTPTSGAVREVDNRLAQLRKTLTAEEAKTKKATTTGMNPVYQTLKTQLALSHGQLAALEARESVLRTHVENYRQQLVDLDSRSLELHQLEREVEREREAYTKYLAKHEEARISTALDRTQIVNLSVVETAAVPFDPVSPQKVLLVMLAGVLGLTTGVGMAFLRDRFDLTVKTPREIEAYVGLPVLTVLPQRPELEDKRLKTYFFPVTRNDDPSLS
jgi:uncharacterized protein involved in exopolysaccharide biosynthesis